LNTAARIAIDTTPPGRRHAVLQRRLGPSALARAQQLHRELVLALQDHRNGKLLEEITLLARASTDARAPQEEMTDGP
jgi:hypothetical protein